MEILGIEEERMDYDSSKRVLNQAYYELVGRS